MTVLGLWVLSLGGCTVGLTQSNCIVPAFAYVDVASCKETWGDTLWGVSVLGIVILLPATPLVLGVWKLWRGRERKPRQTAGGDRRPEGQNIPRES